MHRQRRQFPLIPDGEPCLQEPVSMRLYEEVQQTKHTNSRQLTAKPKVEAKPSFEATVEPAAVTTDKGPVTASILGAPVSAIKRTLAPNGKHSKIHHLANRLQQDSYILAEVAPTYQQPSNPFRRRKLIAVRL